MAGATMVTISTIANRASEFLFGQTDAATKAAGLTGSSTASVSITPRRVKLKKVSGLKEKGLDGFQITVIMVNKNNHRCSNE